MRASIDKPSGRSKTSIAVSVVVHALGFSALMAITFRYPIDVIFGRPDPIVVESVRYVDVTPKPEPVARQGAAVTRPAARGAGRPAEMPSLASIPVGVPAIPAPTAVAGIIGGGGTGAGDTARTVSPADGLRPGVPSALLPTNPMAVSRTPETASQRAERALAAIYAEYVDSVKYAMENPGRKPGDWSWGGKDGSKWGWDDKGIRIGGITIPNVVLAALPLDVGLQGRNMNALIDGRNDAYMRADIKMHGDMMTQDEFRAAVKRIRERVDRERQEKMARAKPRTPPCCG